MATPDMDVIKDIPGYKVILKAVLKSQIQQLVEQLASSTDEESVILTASVSDGTLSHLGSDSGKNFLDDHEDIKSQFLGFCLKRHHKKKQQEKERQEAERQMATTPPKYMPRPGFMGPRQRFTSPRNQGPHPVALTRASPGSGIRGPGMRHSPYPMTRPPRRPPLNFDQQGRGPGPGPNLSPIRLPLGNSNQVIKIEPDDEDSNQSANDTNVQTSVASSSQPSSPSQTAAASSTPSQIKAETSEKTDDDAKSESSSSTIPNEGFSDAAPPEGLSLDSDFSNLISGDASKTTDSSSVQPSTSQSTSEPASGQELDPNVSVKVESMTEAEMELEITGVELGSNNQMAPMSGSQTWPIMGGASGSQADMAGTEQGYRAGVDSQGFHIPISTSSAAKRKARGLSQNFAQSQRTSEVLDSDKNDYGLSGSLDGSLWDMSADSPSLGPEVGDSSVEFPSIPKASHIRDCYICGKMFSSNWELRRHFRKHTGEKPFKCDMCSFRCAHKHHLKTHKIRHSKLNFLNL